MTWLWLPLIAAVVGWLITSLSIWLFFRRISSRRKMLDSELSKLIANQFPMTEIEEKLVSSESFQKLLPTIEAHIDEFLQHKLGKAMPYLGMFIGEKTIKQLKDLFMEELALLFPVVMKKYIGQLQQEMRMEDVLHAKLAAISSERLEVSIKELLAKELSLAKMMGAVAGFIIALIQLAIAWGMGLIG